jgi:L-fuconolactonase
MNFDIRQIPIIDSHLHIWDVDLLEYPWLKDVPAINRTFSISEYREQTADYPITKMIFVQCECLPEQALAEIAFVSAQAAIDPGISGIVAYAPLEKGDAVAELLEQYQQNPLVKGVRRMYDDQPDLCIAKDFVTAVKMLPKYGLTMDLSVKPASIPQTLELIKSCPDTQFILDHLGKPDIKNGGFDQYKEDIAAFAQFPNVTAKISGLVTEADWQSWTVEEIQKYIVYAMGCFGSDRLMFGGDWPVVLLAGSYNQWMQALIQALDQYKREDVQKLLYSTAATLYKL